MAKIESIERILVVEDTEQHIQAAREQLGEYELTMVGDFERFLDAVKGTCFDAPNNRMKRNYNFPEDPKFDAVLSDMNFPMNVKDLYSGYNSPGVLGYAVGMICSQASIPLVGIVSATNHHEGSVAGSLMYLKATRHADRIFQVGDTRIMYFDDDSFGTRDQPKRWDKALECLNAGTRNID